MKPLVMKMAGLATLVLTAPCSAQVRLEVTPLIGAYVPTTSLLSAGAVPVMDFAGLTGETVRQKSGLALGAQVTAWFTSRFAVDGSYAYSGGGADQSAPYCSDIGLNCGGVTGQTQGTTWMASARLRVVAWGHQSGTAVYVLGGPAIIGYSDQPLNPSQIPMSGLTATTLGLVVGAGLGFTIPTIPLSVRAEVDDYRYSAQLYGQPSNIILTSGLSLKQR